MSGQTAKAARVAWRPSRSVGWRPNSVKARSVGEFLPSLMRPAFEKYGFSSAAILTDWAALAGPELAAYTAPERLKWPRQKPGEETGGKAQQTGATLFLRVAGARALEVEHRRPQIIDRLNASFGYRAVAEIRVVQAPLEKRDVRPARPSAPAPRHSTGLENIGEERLRLAIAKLASGIEARQRQP